MFFIFQRRTATLLLLLSSFLFLSSCASEDVYQTSGSVSEERSNHYATPQHSNRNTHIVERKGSFIYVIKTASDHTRVSIQTPTEIFSGLAEAVGAKMIHLRRQGGLGYYYVTFSLPSTIDPGQFSKILVQHSWIEEARLD